MHPPVLLHLCANPRHPYNASLLLFTLVKTPAFYLLICSSLGLYISSFIFTSSLDLPIADTPVHDETLYWMLRSIQQNISGAIGCCLAHKVLGTNQLFHDDCAIRELALYEKSLKTASAFSRRKASCFLCVPGVQANDHCF